MIKHCIGFCFLLFSLAGMAQQFSGKIIDPKPVTMDVVVFPFGMDYPVKIGMVDKDGQVQINLNSIDISKVPDDTKALFFGRLSENFFLNCDYPDSLQISAEMKAINCKMPSLWHNNEWAAALFLVSDEKLQPWIEDQYYKEPVKASFFNILYVDQDIAIDNNCTTTFNLEYGNVGVANSFKIKLKKGFNLVQYAIDEIHKTDPNETSSIPVKMRVINPQENTTIKWMVKYFYTD